MDQPENPLSSPLGAIVDCWLLVACNERRHSLSFLPLRMLSLNHGHSTLLRDILPRLRCSQCRRPPSTLALVEQPYLDRRKMSDDDISAGWRINLAVG